jgi:hypothetical protein
MMLHALQVSRVQESSISFILVPLVGRSLTFPVNVIGKHVPKPKVALFETSPFLLLIPGPPSDPWGQ